MDLSTSARALSGKPLRIWMAQNDKNQGDLAREVGITQSYLSALMAGKLRLTGDILLKVCEVTQIAVNDLVVPFTGDVMGKQAKKRRKKRLAAAKNGGKS